MFTIDWTISIGTILTIVTILGGVVSMYASFKSDLQGLKKDVRRLEEAFTQLGSVLTQVAVQDTRIAMMERHIDELRHGQGFIHAPEKAAFAA